MLDIAEMHPARPALQREESRGAHQRTDFPAARRRAVPQSRAGRTATPDGSPRIERSAGDDHPLAARRTGVRKVAPDGRQHHDCR